MRAVFWAYCIWNRLRLDFGFNNDMVLLLDDYNLFRYMQIDQGFRATVEKNLNE